MKSYPSLINLPSLTHHLLALQMLQLAKDVVQCTLFGLQFCTDNRQMENSIDAFCAKLAQGCGTVG